MQSHSLYINIVTGSKAVITDYDRVRLNCDSNAIQLLFNCATTVVCYTA